MGLISFFARQASKPSGWFGRLFMGKMLNKANASLEDLGLKLMEVRPDSNMLEIGFGNGRLIAKIGEILEDGKITGIEISKVMIAEAEKKNRRLIRSGKVELMEASVEKIPAGKESFDKIFTSNTIYFWPNPGENIREVFRTLKPGGKFYCALRLKDELGNNKLINANPDIFKNLYSKKEMIGLLEKAGFTGVTTHTAKVTYFTNFIAIGTKP